MTSEVLQTQRLRRVPECGTLENPPGSEGQDEGPAWKLPEMENFLLDFKCDTAVFNTCAFQQTEKVRWFKPGQFSGRLQGLTSLQRKCSCTKYYKHESWVGKEKTAKAAKYPKQLAMEVARMVIKTLRTTLELEWWRHKQKHLKESLNEAKRQWASSKEKNKVGPPVEIEKVKKLREGLGRGGPAEGPASELSQALEETQEGGRECKSGAGMRNPAQAKLSSV